MTEAAKSKAISNLLGALSKTVNEVLNEGPKFSFAPPLNPTDYRIQCRTEKLSGRWRFFLDKQQAIREVLEDGLLMEMIGLGSGQQHPIIGMAKYAFEMLEEYFVRYDEGLRGHVCYCE